MVSVLLGKPGEMARKYYNDGADELIFSDIVATLYGRNTLLELVSDVSKNAFVPLTVGGGIHSLDCIANCLRCGADKVFMNSAALKKPDLINDSANTFGSQCVIVAIDAKANSDGSWEALTDGGRERSGRNVVDWVKEAELRGAGEILLTSVDYDGTQWGPDISLFKQVVSSVNIPVIVGGGVGGSNDISKIIQEGISAVAVSSLLHFETASISSLKSELKKMGHHVRQSKKC